MWISRLRRVRRTIIVMGVANFFVIVSGGVLALVSESGCDSAGQLFPLFAVCLAAGVKIAAMVKVGTTQELMAITIMDSPTQNSLQRKLKYKTWLWWTRFAMVITVLQFIGATYLMFRVAKYVSRDGMPRNCVLGLSPDTRGWKQTLQVAFLITVCFVALAQFFTGSDVLQWRSFYATQDDAWKAHYEEVFDHGIREVLCCLGRREYMGVVEEDEVCSVARLLGDLVSYRASGTGHLEFLAGLALLQNNSQFPESYEDCMEAPAFHLQEAAMLHKFAEAAYTGPLLDVGRNPALFLCTWICRQGILTPWSRKWRPKLDGDNWWRGHAAAFLKFINFPAHVLRRGRICREKCKATYFVVVLHYLRCVVIVCTSMAVEMSSKQPTKDFFSSPALSLSLAGIFRNASSGSTNPEEDFLSRRVVDDEDRTVEMSSENSGPTRSRSEEDLEGEDLEEEEEEEGNKAGNKRKRKKYHRHTTDQIRHMEALFKETPHPDEKQRQQLSKQLGLAPRQVKFWFQNRRTQIKAIQERHENSLLKAELEKLREENKAMRESFSKANSSCPNCGGGPDDLHLENSKLKAELDKLRAALGRTPYPLQASCSDDQEHRLGSLDFYTGVFALEKSRITEIANRATLELQKMATSGEPLWLRSVETGREILNYDEYLKEFPQAQASPFPGRKTIEASRDAGIVFMDAHKLAQSFMDVGQWTEMFACLISKAATVDVIRQGEGPSRIDGAIQLMFGEMQLLTPVVPTREVYFVRSCRQLSPEKWAIVDVSVSVEDSSTEKEASLLKCRKLPSGCIIEDTSNGHSKVTWVEHLDVSASTVQPLFRSLVNTGLAFGARHWVATLQLHCERLVFFMATNVPTKDSLGVTTLAGRKSVLKMAQRMTQSFYRAIAASSYHQWTKITTKTGQDMRVSSRKNLHDPGEPTGVIVCASSSLWLPVSPTLLFDFFRDEARRHEWDALSNGAHVQSIASLSKGQDRGNSVAIQTVKSREKSIWVLQDSCTNSYESVVVYAPVDINTTQLVLAGHDPSNIQILPSGFSIIPDGVESRPLVITTTQDDRNSQGGSLLTLALQTLINPSPVAKLNMESVESVTNLVSVTLHNIKRSLQIEDC